MLGGRLLSQREQARQRLAQGHAASLAECGGLLVPKRDLVGALQVLLQTRRLQVARGLAEADTLARELGAFRAKVSLARERAGEDWRERPDDDLVLALALAA